MDGLAAGIKKFDGTGFEVWSTLIQAVLTAKKCKHVIVTDAPENEAERKEWQKSDEFARATLLLAMDQSMVHLVLGCNTSKEVWDRLNEVYSQQTVSCKMMLYQEFYNIKMQPGMRVSKYVSDIELIVKKLKNVGAPIDDQTLIGKIVSGLTSEFRHFMGYWMGVEEKERTYANLLPRLLAEESMMIKQGHEEPVALKATAQQFKDSKHNKKKGKKTDLECYHCGHKGHLKRECRKLKKEQSEAAGAGDKKYATVARIPGVRATKGKFFFDSGASYHMTNDREWLGNYKVHDRPIEILVGNNEKIYSIGSGDVDAISTVDGEQVNVTVQDVHYVPAISDNLFSQGACDRAKHTIITKGGKLNVIADGKTIIQGIRTASNMYVIELRVQAKAYIARAERPIEEWHKALGHPDINEIKHLASGTHDLKIVQHKVDKDRCGECPGGKAHHVSHPDSTRKRSTVPLHRVHADLVGAVEPPTLNRARYFLLIKDEYSSYLYVYFMRTKDETVDKLRLFFNEAAVEAQARVQIIRSDNGSEFRNSSVALLCAMEGAVQEYSAPRIPQQNGEAERANRTVLEMARTMLHSSGLPLNLWGEAVLTAVYLRNRLTNSRNKDKTPFELFRGKPPSYSHLIEFGKEIHVVDSKRAESKFTSKTIEAFMVGYGPRDGTYRVYNPKTQDIMITPDVIVAPHKKVANQPCDADWPYIVFPIQDGGVSNGEGQQPSSSAPPQEPAVDERENIPEGPSAISNQQRVDDDQIAASFSVAQEASASSSETQRSRPLLMIEQSSQSSDAAPGAGEQREQTASIVYPTLPAAPSVRPNVQPSAPTLPSHAGARTAAPSSQTMRTVAGQPSIRAGPFPLGANVRRMPVATSLHQRAEPIHLQGRGILRATPASRTGVTAIPHIPPHRGGGDEQTTSSSAALTSAATVPAARNEGGLSPSKLIGRLTTALRPKRNVQSKYARLAMAIADEPQSYSEAMASDERDKWQHAISDELAALARNKTWEIVPKDGVTREISVKWVFKRKLDADGQVDRYKARLVVRGFAQVAGLDYGEVYAPVVHIDSLRLLFTICAQLNLEYAQFDIATAFLNGELDELIHIQVPEGLSIPTGHTLRLVKSLYGLKQAPRCFNKKFKQVLDGLNMKQICADPCVFTGCGDELIILALYVDDGIVFAKNQANIKDLMIGLKREFELKEVTTNFFLGLEIVQDRLNSTVFLHQRGYAKSILEKFGFNESRAVATPLTTGHSLHKPETLSQDCYECPYQELLGSLNYLAMRTRPDLAYVLSICSKYAGQPREEHWQALKRVLRYIQGTLDYGLIYKPIEDPDIIVYSDADYGGDHENRRSTSGMACFINTGLISYKAQQQQVVTLSTTEAEYIACTLAVKEIMWVKTFLEGLKVKIGLDAMLRCDNQSAIRLIRNSELHQRTKHIDIRHHFIRERYEEGLFQVEYVQTDQQLADIFTKALTKEKHQALCEAIGCVSLGSISPGRVLE